MTVPSFGMRPGSFPRALACLLVASLAAFGGTAPSPAPAVPDATATTT